MRVAVSALVVASALAAGCGDNLAPGPGEPPPLPWAASALPPPPEPADNPGTPEKVQLGWLLFHDPLLSSDRQVACVTCHGQIWGLSDGLPFSIGVGGVGPAGTGRTGPTHTRRNSQSLWNAAYRTLLFWDGRAASLEAQVLGPLQNPVELDRDPEELVTDLRAIPEYVTLFTAAFPGDAEPVTIDNVTRALAAFERTLVSDRSPYDAYVRGDAHALTDKQVKGMFLFAEVGCASCHEPPLFASDRFERGVPGDGSDHGRGEITGQSGDLDKFRVPSLRNARVSGPYFHDGSAATLDEACRHGSDRPLAPDELAAVVDFIKKGLHDESRVPPRALKVPSGLAVPLDGYSVPR